MQNFKTQNAQLNTMLNEGRFMEAFEQFYADQVVMQENETEPRVGKALNREQCGAYAASIPDLKLTVQTTAYSDNLSFQEVLFQYTGPDGTPVEYTEVAVRHWEDGLVVREKFYYNED